MRELIACLHPIESVSDNPLIGEHHTLSYQAGMDPTSVDVLVGGDSSLVYRWGDCVYVGGNAERFRAAIQKIDLPQSTTANPNEQGG
jgi:hypothetical protein